MRAGWLAGWLKLVSQKPPARPSWRPTCAAAAESQAADSSARRRANQHSTSGGCQRRRVSRPAERFVDFATCQLASWLDRVRLACLAAWLPCRRALAAVCARAPNSLASRPEVNRVWQVRRWAHNADWRTQPCVPSALRRREMNISPSLRRLGEGVNLSGRIYEKKTGGGGSVSRSSSCSGPARQLAAGPATPPPLPLEPPPPKPAASA